MQALSGTVGDGGANAVHDAALVQAILVKNRRPARAAAQRPAYLASYDGTCGPQTIAAIRQFQSDHALLNAAGTAAAPNVNATPGRVDAGDATWTAMVANVDAGFADLRVLTGGRIVYVQATQGRVNARLAALANLTFTTAFAAKMRNCINEMSRIHGYCRRRLPAGRPSHVSAAIRPVYQRAGRNQCRAGREQPQLRHGCRHGV